MVVHSDDATELECRTDETETELETETEYFT